MIFPNLYFLYKLIHLVQKITKYNRNHSVIFIQKVTGKMDLLISTDIDYVIQKILIAASLTGTKLNVKKVNESELVKLEPKAKTVVLAANNGSITQHTAIIRYIGDISPLTPLNGLNGFENAQVDQWIDLCWNELGKIIKITFCKIVLMYMIY